MLTTTELAYAKINLYLDVTDRREDGFHNIETLMQSVSLCDTLTLCVEPSDRVEVTLSPSFDGAPGKLPTDGENLAARAALAYLNRCGISAKVHINLDKSIPISAGLGGGSSDAAATLRAMNRIFGALEEDELLSLGATLGSDVPFCIVGGTAFCEGRGERITPLSSGDDAKLYFALLAPTSAVSTPMAYRELDEIFSGFKVKRGGLRASDFSEFSSDIKAGKTPKIQPSNVFELCPSSFTEHTKNAKEALLSAGARFALMSGSGSACFGVFGTKNEAESAKTKLEAKGYTVYLAESVV